MLKTISAHFRWLLLSFSLVISFSDYAATPTYPPASPVYINGKPKVVGRQLVNQCGNTLQLRGMSTHGLQWFSQCNTPDAFRALKNDWKADIVRLALYVNEGGYLTDTAGYRRKVDAMVDSVGKLGMYCMIDWHILTPGDPNANLNDAKLFWAYMSRKHAGKKHVLYEICNEPNGVAWSGVKSYANTIIPIIRANDPETVIILGTPDWSSGVMTAASDPITGTNAYNLMYTFHFYAASHDGYMSNVQTAAGIIPIFATEWGLSTYTGGGAISISSGQTWMNIFNGNNNGNQKISWCNWTFSDAGESSAGLNSGSCAAKNWNNTTASGTQVKTWISSPAKNFISCCPTPTVNLVVSPNDTVYQGTNVTFTATANNTAGGAVSYDFKVNGVSKQSGSSTTYSSSSLNSGDIVTCTISLTGGDCVTSNTAVSSPVTVYIPSVNTGVRDNFNDNKRSCLWAEDPAYTVSEVNGEVKVNASVPASTWTVFILNFPQPIDIRSNPVLTVKLKSSSPVSLRADLADANVFITNANAITHSIGTSYSTYTFDFTGRFTQSWPNAGIVDPTNIKSIQFFVNPGGLTPFNGSIYLDDLVVGTGSTDLSATDCSPKIEWFSPGTATVNQTVQIHGRSFSAVTSVKFNGKSAQFNVVSDVLMTAIVPQGATTGKVSINYPGDSARSSYDFVVLPPITNPGISDDFNDNMLSCGWVSADTSYALSESTGALKVKAKVQNSSWNIFILEIPKSVNLRDNAVLTLKAKANSPVKFRVDVADSNWVTTNAIPLETYLDTSYVNYTFDFTNRFNQIYPSEDKVDSSRIKYIAFFVNPGQPTAFDGMVYLDDMVLGTGGLTGGGISSCPPVLNSFSPGTAPVNAIVNINGSNLTKVTSVKFNGTSADYTIVSDVLILATVPNGAATGKISLSFSSDSVMSSSVFSVLPPVANPGISDNFNDNILSCHWKTNDAAYSLAELNGALKVNANVKSMNWPIFFFEIPKSVNLRDNPVFTVKGKSSTPVKFRVDLADSNWVITNAAPIEYSLGATYGDYTFDFANRFSQLYPNPAKVDSSNIKYIAFFVNPGAVADFNGAVYLDDLVLGFGGLTNGGISTCLPVITSILPGSALPNQIVKIKGQNFTGVTAVRFGDTLTSVYTVDADTLITVTVPARAKTGQVTVITANGTVNSNIVIVKQSQMLSFPTQPTVWIGDNFRKLNASSSSGLPISYSVSNPTIAYVSSDTLFFKKVGSVNVTASQPGNDYFDAAVAVIRPIVISAKQTQSITFNTIPAKLASDAPFVLSATSSSGLPVSYKSSNTAVAIVSNDTVTITGAGTVSIIAMQAGNATYNAAPSVANNLKVTKVAQTITFDALPSKLANDAPFILSATSSSGLPVSYKSSNTSVAVIAGDTVFIKGGGTAIITAVQAGNAIYNAAPSVTSNLKVTKLSQAITFSTLPTKLVTDAPFILTASSNSGLPVTYKSSNTAVAEIAGDTVIIKGAGTANITAIQAGNSVYNAAPTVTSYLKIAKLSQVITFNNLASKKLNDGPFELTAYASSGLPITYTSSNTSVAVIAGDSVIIVGAGSTTIKASQAGDATYLAVNLSRVFTVAKLTQTISFGNIPKHYLGDEPFSVNATSSSGLPVTYVSSDTTIATIEGNMVTIRNIGAVNIKAVQIGNETYAVTSLQKLLTIAAPPVSVARLSLDNGSEYSEGNSEALVNAYPNPSADIFNLTLIGLEGVYNAEVIDVYGKVLIADIVVSSNQSISFGTELPAGQYIINIKTGNGMISKKVVKY